MPKPNSSHVGKQRLTATDGSSLVGGEKPLRQQRILYTEQELLAALIEADKVYRVMRRLDGGRTGAQLALAAVIDWLASKPQKSKTAASLRILLNALVDADRGVETKILGVEHTEKPGLPTEILHQRGFAAIAMDLLISSGLSRMEAATKVARECKAWPCIKTVKHGPAWRAVARWRDDLQAKLKLPNAGLQGSAAAIAETMRKIRSAVAAGQDPVRLAHDLIELGHKRYRY